MLLPLGDSPNPPGRPIVTYGLLAANVLVYVFLTLPLGLAAPDPSDPHLVEYVRLVADRAPAGVTVRQILQGMTAYDLFVFEHGFRAVSPSLADLFLSLFLHGGLLHLAGNMLFLWIYGDNVEHRLGAVRYLAVYLAAGAVATLFHAAFQPRSPLPLIGASGAISGVLGLYFVWFPHNRVRLLLFFPFLLVTAVPARVLLGLYLIVDNLFPFLLSRGQDVSGVAHGAHIGGFLAGIGTAWWIDRREISRRPRDFRDVASRPVRGEAAAVREAFREGHFARAAEAYFALPQESTRGVLSPQESLGLADWLQRSGHEKAALVVYRRHLRDYPSGPGAAEAHFGAGMIQLEALGQETAAYQHLLDALDSDPTPETAARVRAALELIEVESGRPRGRKRFAR